MMRQLSCRLTTPDTPPWRFFLSFFLTLALAFPGLPILAQKNSTGQIKGQITNARDGKPLPGAQIRVIHNAKGLERSTQTALSGNYIIKALPVGSYTVTVSLDGFEAVVKEQIQMSLGGTTGYSVALVPDGISIDEQMVVVGGRVKQFDTTETTTGLVMTTSETEALPVRNSLDAVAMLAPGTAAGDSDFGNGNLVSFGGSSVAENGYYLNGLNITDIRRGIGNVPFPWEAVDQVQVKSAGTPAEFGRHIGGVVNMVTKSGTNQFKFGIKPVHDPSSLGERNPTVFWPNDNGDEELFINNSEDESTWTEYNFYASGPIVKDKAFFYALYNPREADDVWASRSSYYEREQKGDFWLGKLDWYLNENHSLEVMAFNNETDTTLKSYNYSYEIGREDFRGNTRYKTGGDVWSVRYNGTFSRAFSLSASYGGTEYRNDTIPDRPEFGAIWDSRSGTWERLGEWVASSQNQQLHERTNWRVDADWVIGKHTLRFGVDGEELDLDDRTVPTGDGYVEYYTAAANNSLGLPEGTDYLDRRVFVRGGTTTASSDSWYIQDSWDLNSRMTLNLGLRNTTFENTTSDGQAYVDISDQIAPRVGFAWDVRGDGNSKLYANYGRFFMPVSPNTNIRMASGELDEHFIHILDGVNADGSPVVGELIRHDIVSDGQVADADRLFNQEAGPMYSDEYVLGYEQQLQSGWRLGIRGTYRDLIQSIEDVSFSYGMNEWIDQNYPGSPHVGGWFAVLTNPGKPITIPYDVDGDGTKETVTVSPEQLGFPQSERTYIGWEMVAEGNIGDRVNLSASYTWSHNYGNTEGLLRSDNDQADPGWTTSYDYPELMENGFGDLPNDHRHQIKAFGLVKLPASFEAGFNANAVSGRPLNSFGLHPGTECREPCYGRIWYGAISFFTDGEPTPRGSAGRTPWTYNLDTNLAWRRDFGKANLLIKLDVFNLFDFQEATQLEEYAEFDSGAPQSYWGEPTNWQRPRTVRFTIRYDF